MEPFRATYEQLCADFTSNKVNFSAPGFCDDAEFLAHERNYDRYYLNNYASFVAKQPYSESYLKQSADRIQELALLLYRELLDHGRQGACVDISGILGHMLSAEGIWNCLVKGSITIEFPEASGIEPKYFWSVDEGDFVAGHVWVAAPPFTVVDISIFQQGFDKHPKAYLSDFVISEENEAVGVEIIDVISPLSQDELRRAGMTPSEYLQRNGFIPQIFESFTPVQIPLLKGANVKYVPVAIGGLDGTFESTTSMMFKGLTPYQLYQDKIRPLLSWNHSD